ncbi:MAG: AmmeMemoRadiSam system protein A [Candidatus Micrarchaeota archaeon]|nr:AmmeMemoRadiSam system protein A [Candidatus Micrarchaeota archaeon]
MFEYSLKDGEILVEIAHKAIKEYVLHGEIIDIKREFPALPQHLLEKRGAFVTLTINDELRGCIGIPLPIQPLVEAVRDMAISAATEDYRFIPVSESEVDEIQIEISILTLPRELKLENKEEAPRKIKVGRDGLIIESDWQRGLLLPQVAVEENWNEEEFLDHACIKAGLHEGCWKKKETKILTFQAIIFSEDKKGKVKMILPEE